MYRKVIYQTECSVVVLLVGSSSLENDIACYSRFACESELALVQHVFLWLEIDEDCLWLIFLLLFVLRHWWDQQAFWDFAQWKGCAFECTLE